MDSLGERVKAFAQPKHSIGAYTRPVEWRQRWWPSLWRVAVGAALGLALALPLPVRAKTFHYGVGDVPCLIDAIHDANANGKKHTMRWAAGTYTLTKAVNRTEDDTNGLPVITSMVTIQGTGAARTTIERDTGAPEAFRLLQVAATGSLTLMELTFRGGNTGFAGGGLANFRGTVTLTNYILDRNTGDPSGIFNNADTVTLTHCSLMHNRPEMREAVIWYQ
jgi:hypothetical protein